MHKELCLQVISVKHFGESLFSEGFPQNCNYRNIYMLSHAISHISFHFFSFPVSHILSFSKIAKFILLHSFPKFMYHLKNHICCIYFPILFVITLKLLYRLYLILLTYFSPVLCLL